MDIPFLRPGCSHYYNLYGTDASVPVHTVLSAVRDNDCTQNGSTQKSPAFFALVPVSDKYGILRLCSPHIILCFLTLNIASYLFVTSVAYDYRTIGRVPQVSAPQAVLQFWMVKEEPSCKFLS